MYLNLSGLKIRVEKADNYYKKLMGFIGKTNINYGIIFDNCNSIHTFCMKENIDVIGLDQNNKVIYKATNVSKNKIIIVKNKIKNTSILELPHHTSTSIKIGDILTFECE